MSTRHQHFSFDYRTFVASRSKAPGQILTTLNLDKVDLLHAAWGIAGEVMEFAIATTTQNKIEELHDIGFYVQMLENRFGVVTVAPWDKLYSEYSIKELLDVTNTFFDLAKKYVIYNNESKAPELIKAFGKFKAYWVQVVASFGLTEEEANLLNQSKLIKRYANGYSDKAAAERADKAAGE